LRAGLFACLTACLPACLTDCLPTRKQQQHRKQKQQQQQQQLQKQKPQKSTEPLSTQSGKSKPLSTQSGKSKPLSTQSGKSKTLSTQSEKSTEALSTQEEQSTTDPNTRIRTGTLRALGGGPDQPPGGPEGTLGEDQGRPRPMDRGRPPFDRGKLYDRRVIPPSANWTGCASPTTRLRSTSTAHIEEDDRRTKSARPEHNGAENGANSELETLLGLRCGTKERARDPRGPWGWS
jgi:DNA mismatch repair ATPase MutL